MLTRFENDLIDCREGDGIEVLKRRKAELDKLWNEGLNCKNPFRATCIAQEYTRLKQEYNELDSML